MAKKKALISVSDKQGVVAFAQGLSSLGFEILSTGGTAKAMREGGLEVVDVSEFTESPEVMGGRVKTLHPRVHGGLLMRDLDSDREELAKLGGGPIDVVCVNLYPFEETVAKGASLDEAIENIDIGGPSMIRSAAKNHGRVTVVTDPADYERVLDAIRKAGNTDLALRRELARKAFQRTARYDAAIHNYLDGLEGKDEGEGKVGDFPEELVLRFEKVSDLRYGENPHQQAAAYRELRAREGSLAVAEAVDGGGKALSFNNYVDVNAALEAVREFEEPAAVVVKHTNPCGVATGASLEDAFRRAREADSLSAFGGIVALSREVDAKTARALTESFLECVIAPSFSKEALEVLHAKKNLRLLSTGVWTPGSYRDLDIKRIDGGLVVQGRDARGIGETAKGEVVTQRRPTEEELRALDFAWRVCKHVKSNAIVLARADVKAGTDETVGVGAGQMSRVISVEIAAQKAGDAAKGSVLASDAFFPFADGVEAAARVGVRAVVQPGGSKRDAEVIAAADAAGIAMVFTGHRHFRH